MFDAIYRGDNSKPPWILDWRGPQASRRLRAGSPRQNGCSCQALRSEAWYEYLRCFELAKRLEKREYGKNSFFYRIENGMLVDDPELGLLPDEKVHASVENEVTVSVQPPTPEAEADLDEEV